MSIEEVLPPPIGSRDGPVAHRFRPQSISVFVEGDTGVRIRNAELLDGAHTPVGRGLMQGSSPWFFTCDDHLLWRTKNALVHIAFEQGLIGIVGFVVLVVSCLRPRPTVDEASASNDRWIYAVSLLGFFVVASFGTLIDTPWIMALLLSILVNQRGQDSLMLHHGQ